MERGEAVSLVHSGHCLQWEGDSARLGGLEAERDKLECQEQTFGLDTVGNRESLKIHEKGSDR